MKAFFIVLLVVSILYPFYAMGADIFMLAHNQYEGRYRRLSITEHNLMPSRHLGLTSNEIAVVDKDVAFAYTDSVNDGYRLGLVYSRVQRRAVLLDALLFISGIVGLRACRAQRQPEGEHHATQ
jgi:hypothetical protein